MHKKQVTWTSLFVLMVLGLVAVPFMMTAAAQDDQIATWTWTKDHPKPDYWYWGKKFDPSTPTRGVCAGAMLIPANIKEAVAYYRALSFGTVDEDIVRVFAEAMVGIPDLLTHLGAEFEIQQGAPSYFPTLLPGNLQRIQFRPTGKGGFQFLNDLVRGKGIEVLLNTSALKLIQDSQTREVLGLKAKKDGKEINLRARKGVILACGGYEYNPAMLANFNFPGATGYMFPWGTPGNTGDGIQIASEAGAALWHMASIEWGPFCARKPSLEFGTAVGCGVGISRPEASFIFVNRSGKRFMAESTSLVHRKAPLEILSFDHESAEYRNLPAYMIFDESHRSRGPIATTTAQFERMWGGPVGYSMVHKLHEWSGDNQVEIEKSWVIKADTIAELAGKIDADPAALEETVREFNLLSRNKQDTQFGRTENTLAPLAAPPYYTIELALTLVNTQGGPKHNVECQVLDFDDKPIPRLYAAGELGSFFGFLYQGGSNYPEAWAFGQIAGRKAAAELDT